MNIIFICRHNVFRSRVAEAFFKSFNKNKNIRAISGGIFKGKSLSINQERAIKKAGIKLVSKPKNLSVSTLEKQDLAIITADDIPLCLFDNRNYNKKVIKWNIPDVLDNNKGKAERTVNLIREKVLELVNKYRRK